MGDSSLPSLVASNYTNHTVNLSSKHVPPSKLFTWLQAGWSCPSQYSLCIPVMTPNQGS